MSDIADLSLIASGKVREMYLLSASGEAAEERLLMVASDRISTYDAVHPTPIPDKGKVLTGLSAFWFARTGHIVANHLISATDGVPASERGRALVVRRLQMLPGGVRRARLHHGLGLEGLSGQRTRVGHRAAGRACASPSGCPSRSSPPARRPTSVTTRRSTSIARRSWWATAG